MKFKLNNKFLKTSFYVTDLKLCQVRLHNNSKFPWIILIPKKPGVSQILDLSKSNQIKLMEEIQYCSKKMKSNFRYSNLNIEKVGNIIPQLHIHIIPRHKKDPTWPLPVWVTKPKPYSKKELEKIIIKLKKILN